MTGRQSVRFHHTMVAADAAVCPFESFRCTLRCVRTKCSGHIIRKLGLGKRSLMRPTPLGRTSSCPCSDLLARRKLVPGTSSRNYLSGGSVIYFTDCFIMMLSLGFTLRMFIRCFRLALIFFSASQCSLFVRLPVLCISYLSRALAMQNIRVHTYPGTKRHRRIRVCWCRKLAITANSPTRDGLAICAKVHPVSSLTHFFYLTTSGTPFCFCTLAREITV